MKAASAGVLLLSIALSFVWYQVSLQNLKTRLTIRFENDAGEFAYLIAKRIELYSNFLYSAKGLFTASDKIERDEWAAFIHSNDLKSRYPGIQALRYIERVTAAEKENYIARVKADTSLIPAGYPDFQIVPERVMEEYYVVTYVQPYSGNEFMLGYDLSSEASRNKSMKAAADLDEPRATNAVTLLRDTDKGIILFMPVYRKGNVVMDVEARRKNLQGFVDVVIRINDLLKNIYQSGEFSSRFDFKIYDGSDPAASEIIYSSGEPRSPQRGNLSYTTRIDLAGQVWTLVFGSEYERRATSAELFYPKILFAGGTCAGFLLAGLLYVFARTNTRALEIAGRMTESMNLEMQERRKADEKLRELFQQLEIKNQQAQLTRGLADLLQSCSRMQEAFSILASFAEKLFPGTKGELYLINESRNFLENRRGLGGI